MASLTGVVLLLVSLLGLSSGWLISGTVGPKEGEIKSSSCKDDCFYFKGNETFSCENRTCLEIPAEIPPTVKTVILEMNQIRSVNVLNLTTLENIDLSANQIDAIVPGAFSNCQNLRRIDLSLNKITEITDKTFQIKTGAMLATIDLSFNLIKELDNNLFDDDLGKSLSWLDLSDNLIEKIGESAFVNLHRLETLILSTNEITHILPTQFKDMFNLRELDMNDNRITTILNRSFDQLASLVTLDFKDNDIYVIESDAFVGLKDLEVLVLSHNKITTLDPKVFTPLTKLTDLHLDFNPLMTVSITSFPSSLVGLTMTGLSNLEEIPSQAFAHCKSLDNVHLSNNHRLHRIASDAFGGRNSTVRQLNLSNNSLTQISQDLLNWKRLTDIDLRGNRWNCDCQLKWMRDAPFPERNKHEMICADPPHLANHSLISLSDILFTCADPDSNQTVFRNGMIAITTFTFFFVLFVFLYKCRHRVLPCWFAKPGKYFALYNVTDVDDQAISSNGYTTQGIIKHRNGAPAPVHV